MGVSLRGLGIAGALLIGLGAPVSALADCDDPIDGPWDTGVDPEADCDGDGVRPQAGDCDDRDAEVSPNEDEVCGDRVDNDCDGFVDGGCEAGGRGSLQGGASTCSTVSSTVGGLGLLGWIGLAGLRRRRSA